MPKWRRDSEFGTGRRVPLCREKRAQFRAKIMLWRGVHRITAVGKLLADTLLDMIGPDGRLDPSMESLAKRLGVHVSTVKWNLDRMRDCGFLAWVRRLVRNSVTGKCEQTTNAYVLLVPGSDTDFPQGVRRFKIQSLTAPKQRVETEWESRDRQLAALAAMEAEAKGLREGRPPGLMPGVGGVAPA